MAGTKACLEVSFVVRFPELAGQVRHLNRLVMKPKPTTGVLVILAVVLSTACQHQVARAVKPLNPPEQQSQTRALPVNSSPNLKLVIDDATEQVGKTTGYDASYQKIEYPNGDVPI